MMILLTVKLGVQKAIVNFEFNYFGLGKDPEKLLIPASYIGIGLNNIILFILTLYIDYTRNKINSGGQNTVIFDDNEDQGMTFDPIEGSVQGNLDEGLLNNESRGQESKLPIFCVGV